MHYKDSILRIKKDVLVPTAQLEPAEKNVEENEEGDKDKEKEEEEVHIPRKKKSGFKTRSKGESRDGVPRKSNENEEKCQR